ncbi:MAG: molybdopterin-dependent oxidoreductase, partial [Bacillota bacterium]
MRKQVRILQFLALLLVMTLVAVACSAPVEAPAETGNGAEEQPSGQEGEKIVISGLESTDIEVIVEEIKDLKSVTVNATSVSSSGEENQYTVTGPIFDDLLKKYGKSQDDLSGIRLVAGDGYSIEVSQEILQSRDIILAHTIDGQPLDEKTRPIRVVIPEERAMYWIRNLVKIEVLESAPKAEVGRVLILETLISQANAEDYTYYESTDKAVKVEELLELLALESLPDTASFVASDGFEKNEQLDIFSKGYIKFTGEDAPLFLSPDLPKGMHIKSIYLCSMGDVALVSQQMAAEVLGTKEVEDKVGV